jgi:ATP-dependent DNA helicase RecG
LVKARASGRPARTFADAFGLSTVGDLLYHFPRRYEERGSPTDIASLVVGEDVTVQARVRSAQARNFKNRPGALLEAVVEDGSGRTLKLTFFGKNFRSVQWRTQDLVPVGQPVRGHGERLCRGPAAHHPDYDPHRRGQHDGRVRQALIPSTRPPKAAFVADRQHDQRAQDINRRATVAVVAAPNTSSWICPALE